MILDMVHILRALADSYCLAGVCPNWSRNEHASRIAGIAIENLLNQQERAGAKRLIAVLVRQLNQLFLVKSS